MKSKWVLSTANPVWAKSFLPIFLPNKKRDQFFYGNKISIQGNNSIHRPIPKITKNSLHQHPYREYTTKVSFRRSYHDRFIEAFHDGGMLETEILLSISCLFCDTSSISRTVYSINGNKSTYTMYVSYRTYVSISNKS